MNRSNLIDNLSNRLPYMKKSEVGEASLLLIDLISNTLYENDRVEVTIANNINIELIKSTGIQALLNNNTTVQKK